MPGNGGEDEGGDCCVERLLWGRKERSVGNEGMVEIGGKVGEMNRKLGGLSIRIRD